MEHINKSESKYFNTAIRMDEAFMEILEKKDLEYITVKEICEKAKVNRSTSYLHYETIGDLLSESISYMNEQFLSYFPKGSESIASNINHAELRDLYLVTPKFLKPYLEYIKEHRKLFSTAISRSNALGLENSYDKMFTHVLSPILDRFSIPENEKKYVLAFYIHGIMAVVKEWLKLDCEDSIDFVMKIIEKQIKTNFGKETVR